MECWSNGNGSNTPSLRYSNLLSSMQIIESISAMREWGESERRYPHRIVLVPTMGFLHEGHLCLVRDAKRRGDRVVVSIFVNPKQFGPTEDFAAYPRDLERDVGLLEKEGVDILFHPSVEGMYPAGAQTHIEVCRFAAPLGRGIFAASPPSSRSFLISCGRMWRSLARKIISSYK